MKRVIFCVLFATLPMTAMQEQIKARLEAAKKGDLKLLQMNVTPLNVNIFQDEEQKVNEEKNSLLHLAITNDLIPSEKITMVRWLINAGADIEHKDREGNTPLHIAAATRQSDIAELLVTKGASIDAINGRKKRPLDVAKERRRNFAVIFYLEDQEGLFYHMRKELAGMLKGLDRINIK